MTGPVNPRPRHRQVVRTEQRVLDAATRLFVEKGYPSTTVADVAEAAGVGARTVYVRFETKAALFKRVVDVAIVGDAEEIDVLGRDWMHEALHAATAAERIAALAAATCQILGRAGELFAVAQQAAATEPLIEAYWEQGRQQSRYAGRVFWTRMADDGLLDPAADLDWLVDGAAVLHAAETYLVARRMVGWTLPEYEEWLRRVTLRLL